MPQVTNGSSAPQTPRATLSAASPNDPNTSVPEWIAALQQIVASVPAQSGGPAPADPATRDNEPSPFVNAFSLNQFQPFAASDPLAQPAQISPFAAGLATTPDVSAKPKAAKVTQITGLRAIEGDLLVWNISVVKSASITSTTFSLKNISPSDGNVLTATNGVKLYGVGVLTIPANVTGFQIRLQTKNDGKNEQTEYPLLTVGNKSAAATLYDFNSRQENVLLQAAVASVGPKDFALSHSRMTWTFKLANLKTLSYVKLTIRNAIPSSYTFSSNVIRKGEYIFLPPRQTTFSVTYIASIPDTKSRGKTSVSIGTNGPKSFERTVLSDRFAVFYYLNEAIQLALNGNKIVLAEARRVAKIDTLTPNLRFSRYFNAQNKDKWEKVVRPDVFAVLQEFSKVSNLTIQDTKPRLTSLANESYEQLKINLMVKANNLLTAFDSLYVRRTFTGSSSDIFNGLFGFYNDLQSYIANFTKRLIEYQDEFQVWSKSFPKTGDFAADHIAVTRNFTRTGLSMADFYAQVGANIRAFSEDVQMSTSNAVAAYEGEINAEKTEAVFDIILGSFSALSMLGSLGFFWSNAAATTKQLNTAMEARNSKFWQFREFFLPEIRQRAPNGNSPRGTWIAGNGPAAFGSVTLLAGNTAGSVINFLRASLIQNAVNAGWTDDILGDAKLDVERFANDVVAALNTLVTTLNDMQLKLMQFGGAGNFDVRLGSVRPYIADAEYRKYKFITLDDAKKFGLGDDKLLESMDLIWINPSSYNAGFVTEYAVYGLPHDLGIGRTYTYYTDTSGAAGMAENTIPLEEILSNYTAGTVGIQDAGAGQSVYGLASEAGNNNADPPLTGAASPRLAGDDLGTAARSVPPLWSANSLSFANGLTG